LYQCTRELRHLGPSLIEAGKALGQEHGPVLGGAKQRLGIYALSSLTCGREYEGLTPSQCHIYAQAFASQPTATGITAD